MFNSVGSRDVQQNFLLHGTFKVLFFLISNLLRGRMVGELAQWLSFLLVLPEDLDLISYGGS